MQTDRRLPPFFSFLLVSCLVSCLVVWQARAAPVERPSVDGWPGFAVGKVNIRGGGFCTATLIRFDQALTSAHCLRDGAGQWYPAARLVVEFAPNRATRRGSVEVAAVLAAPGLAFGADGKATDPARDWAVLELGRRDRMTLPVNPVTLASPSERDALVPGAAITLLAYTPERPYVATLAEGCQVVARREQPEVLLHDCVKTAAVAGAAVLTETPRGTALVGIQIGTGVLNRNAVGVAALLERSLDPTAFKSNPIAP